MQPKKHLLATFSVLLIAALLVACASPAAAPPATPVPPTATPTFVPPTALPSPDTATPAPPSLAVAGKVELKKGEITSQALAGNLLGDPTTRQFFVLLPPGYATSDKRYPVVYVLHWYTGQASALVGPIRQAYEATLRTGDLQEMIFVFPDANNRLGGSMYLSSPTIGDYETYITRELVDYIDANYRTIKNRVSRGITGCSMGGDGSIYLALKYPDVFSVAAPVSGTYYSERDPTWQRTIENVDKLPEDFYEIHTLGWEVKAFYASAAATASNPDKPPFYLDTPLAIVDGTTQIVPEVFDKIAAADPAHEVDRFLTQPERLNAILILHGEGDNLVPVELARDFDQLLSDRGIEHEYLEIKGGHCDFDFDPVVTFMSDHLVGEEQP